MKLCVIANAETVHAQKWARYFVGAGYDVDVISPARLTGPGIEGATVHVLDRSRFRVRLVTSAIDLFSGAIQIRRLLKGIRPDIVHAHYITDNGVMAAMTGFHPLVLSPWGSDVLVDPERYRLFRPFMRYALGKADVIICNSETLREGTLRLAPVGSKFRSAVFGVDTQLFSPEKRDENLKSTLGIQGAPTVISIRSLEPVYNIQMFIKSIPLVRKQVPAARFIVGGEGRQRKALEELAGSLGISDVVRFTGWIRHEDVARYLASSDVYVSTSYSDSTALSQKEALACGLPPVVTRIPGNEELITEGVTGFFVPIDDHEALAVRIVCLLQDADLRDRVGKAGRKLIVETAEYRTEMAKAQKIYEELLDV